MTSASEGGCREDGQKEIERWSLNENGLKREEIISGEFDHRERYLIGNDEAFYPLDCLLPVLLVTQYVLREFLLSTRETQSHYYCYCQMVSSLSLFFPWSFWRHSSESCLSKALDYLLICLLVAQ